MPVYKYQIFDTLQQYYVIMNDKTLVYFSEVQIAEALHAYQTHYSDNERFEIHRIKIGEVMTIDND